MLDYLIGKILQPSVHEHEIEALQHLVEAGKLGSMAVKAKMDFDSDSQSQGLWKSKSFSEMVRAWNRYLRCVDSSSSIPKPKLVTMSFHDILKKDDSDIMNGWKTASAEAISKLTNGCEGLEATMSVGADWKADLSVGASIEEVSQAAEETLMAVKGKKLTMQKDSLLEARYAVKELKFMKWNETHTYMKRKRGHRLRHD